MSEVLDKIDSNLSRIEERLLSEFLKIQQSQSETGYGTLAESLQQQIKEAIGKLRHRLDHSGSGRLELTTDYHEVLRARMYVLERLLERKVPTACMQDLYQPAGRSTFTARDLTGDTGGKLSSTQITRRVVVDREASNRSFLSFFKGHFGGQRSGAHNIRVDSVESADRPGAYSDSGPYAAAQQLAALASSAVTYREIADAEGEAAARAHLSQLAKGKASFGARDLTSAQEIKTRDIARSPEEIRKKLEARRLAAEKAGKASFTAVDLSPVPDPDEKKPEAEKPKEKARFEARDLSSRPPDKR